MKTFTESQGFDTFDWWKALEGLKDGEPAPNQKELEARSRNWVTCACGNMCDAIPRYKVVKILEEDVWSYDWGFPENKLQDRLLHLQGGAPIDDELEAQGHEFYHYIREYLWEAARLALQKIEDRSIELLTASGHISSLDREIALQLVRVSDTPQSRPQQGEKEENPDRLLHTSPEQ